MKCACSSVVHSLPGGVAYCCVLVAIVADLHCVLVLDVLAERAFGRQHILIVGAAETFKTRVDGAGLRSGADPVDGLALSRV